MSDSQLSARRKLGLEVLLLNSDYPSKYIIKVDLFSMWILA